MHFTFAPQLLGAFLYQSPSQSSQKQQLMTPSIRFPLHAGGTKQARQEAERQILAAACENGIMQRAADEAKRSMEQFLRLLEFEQITVIATPGPCVVAQR